MSGSTAAVSSPIFPQAGLPCESINGNTSSNFAFLVHSQQTLTDGLPPNFDNRPFMRPRRRRTSPVDHAILEAEYQHNPKPDKLERLSIVERVALGEKEVQIWFQNRRQQTRRKTQPLLPHEVFASLHSNQDGIENASSSSPVANASSQPKLSSSQTTIYRTQGLQSDKKETDLPNVGPEVSKSPAFTSLTCTGAVPTLDSHLISTDLGSQSLAQLTDPDSNTSQNQNGPAASHDDFIEDTSCGAALSITVQHTRVGSIERPKMDKAGCSGATPINPPSHYQSSVRSLKRTTSSVRLSLSLDGKAQVVMEIGSSPSPPRPKPTMSVKSRNEPLMRSQSEVGPGSQPFQIIEREPVRLPLSTPAGRSRDARTWEFYCDSDTRNALTIQAEEEQKGSAERAISLIRSSKSRVSEPTIGSRSMQETTGKDSIKRKKNAGQSTQKPKLARTASSFARLQTVKHQQIDIKVKSLKPDSQSSIFWDPDGDSDKENWEPGTQRRVRPRIRGVSTQPPRDVLGENARNPGNSLGLEAVLNRQDFTPRRRKLGGKLPGKTEKKAANAEGDTGVVLGESGEEEDLDCVQNLLSLSQGAWR